MHIAVLRCLSLLHHAPTPTIKTCLMMMDIGVVHKHTYEIQLGALSQAPIPIELTSRDIPVDQYLWNDK